MKAISILLVLSVFLPTTALAQCDFSKDIKDNNDNTYTYTRDCHIEVGKRVKRLELVDQQVIDLNKAIELKDVALTKQKERADVWMDSSLKINDKLQSYDSVASKNQWIYFGLGVAATILSVWAAGQLAKTN